MRIVGPFETLSRTSDDRIQPTIPIALVPLGRMLFGDALQLVTSPYFRPGPKYEIATAIFAATQHC